MIDEHIALVLAYYAAGNPKLTAEEHMKAYTAVLKEFSGLDARGVPYPVTLRKQRDYFKVLDTLRADIRDPKRLKRFDHFVVAATRSRKRIEADIKHYGVA